MNAKDTTHYTLAHFAFYGELAFFGWHPSRPTLPLKTTTKPIDTRRIRSVPKGE
jgi:hypothetical protein